MRRGRIALALAVAVLAVLLGSVAGLNDNPWHGSPDGHSWSGLERTDAGPGSQTDGHSWSG